MIKILVMGATGFLGKRVVKRLNEERIAFLPASTSLGTDFRKPEEFEALFRNIDRILPFFSQSGASGNVSTP